KRINRGDCQVTALEKVGEALHGQVERHGLVVCVLVRRAKETIPLIRKLVPTAEKSHERRRRTIVTLVRLLEGVPGGVTEDVATLACSVLEMQDDVGERVGIEGIVFPGQVDPPPGYGPGTFEGQVALVPEVELKHSAVVLAMAGGDRLHRGEVSHEAFVP